MTVQELIDEYKVDAKSSFVIDSQKILERHNKFRKRILELPSPTEEISLALTKFLDNPPCESDLNFWLEAAELRPSLSYLDSLCKLLEQESNCIWHEGIIYVLEKLNDERAIPALKRAILHDLDYEFTKEVAATALKALAKIGTVEAIQVLEVCRKYPDNLVRRTARNLLKRIEERKQK